MSPKNLTPWSASPAPDAHPALRSPARLAALHATGLLYGAADDVLDRLTRVAAKVLGVPTSAVTLVDDRGQSFAGMHGIGGWAKEARGTPLTHSFCQHVVIDRAPFIVTDARIDERVRTNQAVAELDVVAYAGVPLVTADGDMLGALCAIDVAPKNWSASDVAILEDLAAAAVAQLNLRVALEELSAVHAQLHDEHTQLRTLERQLSLRDEQTGLLSRRGFDEALRAVVAEHYGDAHALLSIAVDGDTTTRMTAAARLAAYPASRATACVGAQDFLALVSTSTTSAAQHAEILAAQLLAGGRDGSLAPRAVRVGSTAVLPGAPGPISPLIRAAVTARDASDWTMGATRWLAERDTTPRTRRGAILLIDEFPGRLAWAASWLESQGWLVESVSSVADALAYQAMLRARGETLVCLLTDDGVQEADGHAIGMLLRFEMPALPVILLSGNAAPTRRHPHDLVLAKPCDPQQLLAIIEACVTQSPPAGVPAA